MQQGGRVWPCSQAAPGISSLKSRVTSPGLTAVVGQRYLSMSTLGFHLNDFAAAHLGQGLESLLTKDSSSKLFAGKNLKGVGSLPTRAGQETGEDRGVSACPWCALFIPAAHSGPVGPSSITEELLCILFMQQSWGRGVVRCYGKARGWVKSFSILLPTQILSVSGN